MVIRSIWVDQAALQRMACLYFGRLDDKITDSSWSMNIHGTDRIYGLGDADIKDFRIPTIALSA